MYVFLNHNEHYRINGSSITKKYLSKSNKKQGKHLIKQPQIVFFE